jgi:hypothetical protein
MFKGIKTLKRENQKISKKRAFRYLEAGKRGYGLIPN